MSTLQEQIEIILERIFGKINAFNLLGKDYFNVKEAAHYMCVSVRYFQEIIKEYGIISKRSGRKIVYAKSDLIAAIERGSINPVLPH